MIAAWEAQQPLPGEVGAWTGEQAPGEPCVANIATSAFEAYAVLPNGTEDASLSERVAARLRALLAGWTQPDEECVQAIWEGYGEMGGGMHLVSRPTNPLLRLAQEIAWRRPRVMPKRYREQLVGAPVPRLFPQHVEELSRFEMPDRIYLAFAATLDDLAPHPWRIAERPGDEQSPTVFWPASRTWLVASEIDFDVTLVGGPADLIEAIVADPILSARQVQAADPIDPTWDMDYPYDES